MVTLKQIQEKNEERFCKADPYREHLVKLTTVQHRGAIPREVENFLWDEVEMIYGYDGTIFLTKLGVMYLRNRGLI